MRFFSGVQKLIVEMEDGDIPTKLVKKMNFICYSHAHKMVNELESMGIIKTEKIGRIRLIRFTEKGKKVKEHLKRIMELVG